jgi:uncharacterized protein (DUF488 family)
MTELFTIGFTRKTAEEFFTRLKSAHIRRILDIRLNNSSQLAGFAKRNDLQFFLREIRGIEYVYLPEFCPTEDMLDAYKNHRMSWKEYEDKFTGLLKQRKPEKNLDVQLLDHGCLLCSEDKPDHCHRRLVAEYLSEVLGDLKVVHL